MTETVLSFEHVSKRLGNREVLKDISFPLARGQCVALTGLNGSGKTTLLKLAAGLTRATSGKILRHGRLRIRYIPESFPQLSVCARSLLCSLGRTEGIDHNRLLERIDELLDAFHLKQDSGNALQTYSKGMLQKVSVIQAFLSGADVLLLDEPLSGQDAQAQETFTRRTKQMLAGGTAVLLACHERHLIRSLADTLFELGEGTLHPAKISQQSGTDHYLFRIPGAEFEIPQAYAKMTGIRKEGEMLYVTAPGGGGDEMLRAMLDGGCSLREMRHEEND